MLWLPEPRASITRGVCGGPARVLLRWWTIQLEYGLGVEAMMKANMKGNYENLECRACKVENESQQHVFECKEIDVKLYEKETFEELIEGTLRQKIQISEYMRKRIDKLQEIEKV